jgi:uncharacterized protein (DUF1501 family)
MNKIETYLLINGEEVEVTVSATVSREPEHGTDGRHYVTEVTLEEALDSQNRVVPIPDDQYEQLVEEVIEAAAMARHSAEVAAYEARRERLGL